MGLRDDIQEALTEAFDDDLQDVVSPFVLVKQVAGVYDPVNDTYSAVGTTYDGRGVFASFGANEVDGTSIKSEDEKLIVNGVDLAVRPDVDDVVRLTDGQEYLVINPTPVMGGGGTPIVYIIQIRKSTKKNG